MYHYSFFKKAWKTYSSQGYQNKSIAASFLEIFLTQVYMTLHNGQWRRKAVLRYILFPVLPYDSTQCLVYMSHAINISWIKDEGIDKYKAYSYIFIVQLHLLAGSAQQQSSFLKNSSSENLWVPFIHSCHLLITSLSYYWTSLSSFF